MNRHFAETLTVMTAFALRIVSTRGLYAPIHSGNNPTRSGIRSWHSLTVRFSFWTHFLTVAPRVLTAVDVGGATGCGDALNRGSG